MSKVDQKNQIKMESVVASDFVVHTKHTCDVCFRQPILGKRYTSIVHPNFDMCARCFAAYSGPEIGLTEAALTRDKKHSRDFVIKLKIKNGGDVQVRRVKVSDIWGKSTSQLSFVNLMSITSRYAFPQDKDGDALDAFISITTATYIDGDGDKITMTSDTELEDSFVQVLKKFPECTPFRITVTIPKGYTNKACVTHAFYGVTAGEQSGMTRRIKLRKIEPKKDTATVSKDKMAVALEGQPAKTTLVVTPQKFEKDFFVHARHTCDGCSKSPITGTRHHATKIPNFDLCGACFEKYEGEDLDFKPEINDRDRRMQQRWLKRQLKDTSRLAGDIFDFFKKMQESGDSIGSADKGNVGPELKDSEKFPARVSSPCCSFSSPSKEEQERVMSKPEGEVAAELAAIKLEKLRPTVDEGDNGTKSADEAYQVMQGEDDGQAAYDRVMFKPEGERAAELAAIKLESLPATTLEAPTIEKAPESPDSTHDKSFLSDADGSGSIAEAIGRTLDVCVQEIEKAIADGMEQVAKVDAASSCSAKESSVKFYNSKVVDEDAVVGAAEEMQAYYDKKSKGWIFSGYDSKVVDEDVVVGGAEEMQAYYDKKSKGWIFPGDDPPEVAKPLGPPPIMPKKTSEAPAIIVSNMTDALKKMDDVKKAENASHDDMMQFKSNDDVLNEAGGATAPTIVPSLVAGKTILKSDDGTEEDISFEMPKVEDASDGEDWSVISDDKVEVKHDGDIARAAELIGSTLFKSDTVANAENEVDKSVSSTEPLSPVVLAKWDTELVQLHELGFLNDRKNIDVMERLEASHMGVDSTEKITVQNVVEHLLGGRA